MVQHARISWFSQIWSGVQLQIICFANNLFHEMYSCEQTSTTATCICVYRQVELTQYNYNELLMICKASRVICIFSQFDQLDTHFLSFARICYEQRLLPSRSDTHSFSFSMFSNTKKCRGKKNAYGETSENIEWLHISLNELIKKYPRNSSYLSLYQSTITQYPMLPRGWTYCIISRRYDIL